MRSIESFEVLSNLAEHNKWANQKIFDACSNINPNKLIDESHGYDSVIGILKHLVQVEHSFFELAHGRQPQKIQSEELKELHSECSNIDRAYLEYVKALMSGEVATNCFLVPWFGFEISVLEGILQPMTHSHKHRADVSMLLPLLGEVGIEMDFIQWLAEQRGEGSD
jgi:uncharacterized damage-inducible protein DinB